MASVSWKSAAVLLVLAAFLRLWGTFEIQERIDDEPIHVPNAISLGTWGTTTSSNWAHPPLSGLLLYGSLSLLGDNPWGWRAGNVLFGLGSVVLLYLVALRLFPGSSVPLLVAALLALDPFHVYHSRTTYMEVPVTFFFLGFLYFMLEFSERGRPWLPWAGIAAGLTVATKAYFVLALPLTAAYAFRRALRRGERGSALAFDFLEALVLLPVAVYLLCHLPWFGRGYGLLEFARMKLDAFRSMQGFSAQEFISRSWIEAGGRPWEWFLKPFMFGSALPSAPGDLRLLLEINNFPFRLLSIPALLASIAVAWSRRDGREALAPALFASVYALFLAVDRPMFSYSATVLLPFAYLSTARVVDLLSQRLEHPARLRGALLVLVALWGLYTFPLAAGRTVPRALYEPVLPLVRTVGPS